MLHSVNSELSDLVEARYVLFRQAGLLIYSFAVRNCNESLAFGALLRN